MTWKRHSRNALLGSRGEFRGLRAAMSDAHVEAAGSTRSAAARAEWFGALEWNQRDGADESILNGASKVVPHPGTPTAQFLITRPTKVRFTDRNGAPLRFADYVDSPQQFKAITRTVSPTLFPCPKMQQSMT